MLWIRRLIVVVGLGYVATMGSKAAPTKQAYTIEMQLIPFHQAVHTETFQGSEPARVIVIGDGSSALGLYVFDQHGNCVAKDDLPSGPVKDDNAVLWYPQTQQQYRIVVANQGALPNTLNMAVR